MSSIAPLTQLISPTSPPSGSEQSLTLPLSYQNFGSAVPHSQTKSLPIRAMPTSPATPPTQAHLSPASRDRHLKHLLEAHRADRARIQQGHPPAAEEDAQMLTDKLQRALQEVRRLDREFQNFQAGANARLARALEENERLRARIAKIGSNENIESRRVSLPVGQASIKDNVDNIKGDGNRRTMKPSEKELEVERLRQPCQVPSTGRTRAWRDTTQAARKSFRVLRRVDPNVKSAEQPDRETTGLGGAKQTKSIAKENDEGSRKSVRLPRSFSRKWSTCF